MGQTREIIQVGAGYRANQKVAKNARKEAAATQAVVAVAQSKAKKARKVVRRKSNKKK